MGRPKAWLPFGEETMLQRVVRTLEEVVSPIVVVAAPDQDVPPVPKHVRIVRDEQEGFGPLAGLAAGLTALDGIADAAYASSCDVPLLSASFVQAVIGRLGDHDLAIPREDRPKQETGIRGQESEAQRTLTPGSRPLTPDKYHHPLAAVYRTPLGERCAALLTEGRRRPLDLVRGSRSCEIEVDELRAVDPNLDSLRNANTPEEYAALLKYAGFDVPAD